MLELRAGLFCFVFNYASLSRYLDICCLAVLADLAINIRWYVGQGVWFSFEWFHRPLYVKGSILKDRAVIESKEILQDTHELWLGRAGAPDINTACSYQNLQSLHTPEILANPFYVFIFLPSTHRYLAYYIFKLIYLLFTSCSRR